MRQPIHNPSPARHAIFPPPSPTRFAALTASAMIAVAGLACAASAQSQPKPSAPVNTSDATGRDFAGLLLEMPELQGGFTATSRSAWTWVEDAPLAPSVTGEKRTIGAPVQRMYLKSNVRVQLGTSRLSAARAVVWVERIDDGTEPEDRALYQVAIYFDRVNNPIGASGTGVTGDRLLVTARVRGAFTLAADAPPNSGRPTLNPPDDLVTEGERRLARYLNHLEEPGAVEAPPAMPRQDPNTAITHFIPSLNRPYEPGSPYGANGPRAPITKVKNAPGLDPTGTGGDQRLFSGRGVLVAAAGQPVLQTEGGENRIVITGGVVLQYSEPSRDRGLQLSAQNAVIFLKPGKIDDLIRTPADAIQGIYLEGDVVATDNKFTLRAPYVYYDLIANQAYTVDAVFWTYDDRRGLPLYVRADSIRQTTRNSVTAQGVTIAASSFYDPILTLGASSVTVSRVPDPDSGSKMTISGKNFVPRIGGLPFAWIPSYNGDLERFPLKDVRFENSSDSGFGVQTRWDLFGLTGLKPPEDMNLDIDLLIDAWFKRGVAVGGDVRWKDPDNTGSILGYYVPNDHGTDVLASGVKVEQDGTPRGLALYDQRVNFDNGWMLLTELSSISDANFVAAYYEQLAETRREFTTSGTAKYNSDNTLFTFQGQGSLDDFSPNQYLLQSQGYNITKLPELTYTRIADDLMSETNPGVLLWTHEYRLSRISQNYFKTTPNQLGYPNPLASPNDFMVGFGPNSVAVGVNQSFEQAALGAGYTEDNVLRADTRQQLEWNMNFGPVHFQPFLLGRLTYYDNEFVGLATSSTDQLRWWGGGGARASTQVQRVYDGVESAALDIHQIRHIVEPNATIFSAGTNRQNTTLPEYDYSVEGGEQGTGWRFGLNQTFQTLRGRVNNTDNPVYTPGGLSNNGSVSGGGGGAGGAGSLASGRPVDLLRWNVDYVNGTADTNKNGALGKWFDYRPEESIFGNYINSETQLLLTDSTTLVSGTTYDMDINQPSRTSVGVLTDHGRDFRSFAELRYLNILDSTYVTLGGDFRLSALYNIGATAAYDTDASEFQDVAVRINREFPDLTMTFRVRYNNITGETSMGLIFTPLGRNRRLDNMRRLGRDQYLDPLLDAPAGPTEAAP